ncbi:MAG: hypothetical protein KDK40_03995, partial [Chlamydiia bacterium]|nr:hypothetical protein [Chlamydiia bacterium]
MNIFLESIPFGVVQAYSERTQENRRLLDALISDRNLWQKIASYLDFAALNALKVSCHFFEIPCDKAIVEKLNHQSNLSKIFIELTTSVKRKVPCSFHLPTAGQTAAKNFLQKIQSGVAGP